MLIVIIRRFFGFQYLETALEAVDMDIDDSLVDHLVEGGCLTRDALGQVASLRVQQPQASVSDWLLRLGLLSEASLAQAWSATLGWQRFDPQASVTPDAALPPFPLRFLIQHCVVPVGMTTDGQLQVVVARPSEPYALRAVAYATGLKVLPLVGSHARTELIVLITPKVVTDSSTARQITDEYRQQLQLLRPEVGEGRSG